MKVKYAEHVIRTIAGGLLPPGTLWISGYLDEQTEALKTLRRHAARKRRVARKLGPAPTAVKHKSPKRSR